MGLSLKKSNAQCRRASMDINRRAHKALFSETMRCPEFWRVPLRTRSPARGTHKFIYLHVESLSGLWGLRLRIFLAQTEETCFRIWVKVGFNVCCFFFHLSSDSILFLRDVFKFLFLLAPPQGLEEPSMHLCGISHFLWEKLPLFFMPPPLTKDNTKDFFTFNISIGLE